MQRDEEEVDPVDEDGGRPEDLDDEEKDAVGEDASQALLVLERFFREEVRE